MTKVFIGGSRRVTRLNRDVTSRIDRIVAQGFAVLVGDASGADKAVQDYLLHCGCESVEVFCSAGACRNNAGHWPVRAVAAPHARKDFDFYAAKDEQMAEEASIGFMIWDGKSAGTLANVARLLHQDKNCVLYNASTGQFLNLRTEADLEPIVSSCEAAVREKVRSCISDEHNVTAGKQARLL